MAGEAPPRTRPLSEWLQLMLAEIAARREALERAAAEEARRRAERAAERDGSRRDAHLS
jgi:hypothetical protein